ncbi:MAG: phage terminase large subunit family protein, partial [Verrucomicrobiota bacterium]
MIFGPSSPFDFVETRMQIPDGQHKGDPLLLRDVPHFREPLEKVWDDEVVNVTILKATGAGGTTLAECASTLCGIKRPVANLVYNVHVDSKVALQANRLFGDQWDNIPEIAAMYRDNRYDRDLIAERRCDAPDFNGVVQAANFSNAQSIRAGVLILDELWAYKPEVFEEMKKRVTGDFPFYKIIAPTTAAQSVEHPAHQLFEEGCRAEFHLRCPHKGCGELIWLRLGKYSRDAYNGHHVIQWKDEGTIHEKASSVFLVCPWCGKKIKNTPQNRRSKMLDGAEYVWKNPEAPVSKYSCRFTAFDVFFQPWESTLEEYLKAAEKLNLGLSEAYRDFMIKSVAITWDGQLSSGKQDVHVSGDYDLVPFRHESLPAEIFAAPDDG